MQSDTGIRYSALLHALLLILLIFGLPDFLRREPDPEPEAISVEVLPLAPVSNVKPQDKSPEKVEEKKPPQDKAEPKPTPQTHKEEPKPEPRPEPLPAPKPLPAPPKPKPRPPEKPKPKKPEEDLDSILRSVKNSAKAEEAKQPKEESAAQPDKAPAKSSHFDASMPLSMSEKDLIRSQFQKCWDVPAGAKDAYNLVVTLRVQMSQDGAVTRVELARDQGRYNTDSFFRAAADSAIRGVNRCSPLKNLPADKYGAWSDMELTFDPKEMLY